MVFYPSGLLGGLLITAGTAVVLGSGTLAGALSSNGRTGGWPPDIPPTPFGDAVSSTLALSYGGYLDPQRSLGQLVAAVLVALGVITVVALRRGFGPVTARYRTPDFVRVNADDQRAINWLAGRIRPAQRVLNSPNDGAKSSPEGWAGTAGFTLAPGFADLTALPGLVPVFTSGSVTVYSLDLGALRALSGRTVGAR